VVDGEVKKDGMVLDFCELERIVEGKVIATLDHQDLNNILPNPTA
jgi:6-pyruvoyl-tetrahydropterin synthase